MPYPGIPANLTDKMERCVKRVMAQGKSKSRAIAICHDSIMGGKKINFYGNYWQDTAEKTVDNTSTGYFDNSYDLKKRKEVKKNTMTKDEVKKQEESKEEEVKEEKVKEELKEEKVEETIVDTPTEEVKDEVVETEKEVPVEEVKEEAIEEVTESTGESSEEETPVEEAEKAKLTTAQRKKIPGGQFAYIDSKGGKHLPIHDKAHVRNAMARFNQTQFESSEKRKSAARKIIVAAKRMGVEVDPNSTVVQAAKKIEGVEVEKVRDVGVLLKEVIAKIDKLSIILQKQDEPVVAEKPTGSEKPVEAEGDKEEVTEEPASTEGVASEEKKEEAPESGEGETPKEETTEDASPEGAEVTKALGKFSDSIEKVVDRIEKFDERLSSIDKRITEIEEQPVPSKIASPIAISKGDQISSEDESVLKEIDKELEKLRTLQKTNLDQYQREKKWERAFDLIDKKNRLLASR